MEKAKTLEELNKKYGIKGSTTPTKNEDRKQSKSASSSSKNSKSTNNSTQSALDKLNEKYGITGNVNAGSFVKKNNTFSVKAPTPTSSKNSNTKKYSDFNTETKNAYTSAKDKVTSKTTIKSKLSDDERNKRIKEINSEISSLKSKLSGYSRASAYGTNSAMKEAKKRDSDRIAELTQELKNLERVGTFSASELKQFEIDDAKAKVSSARQKVNSYGARPTLDSAESYKQANSDLFKAREELENLERQKALYDDIADFGYVSHDDTFTGQWRANYRSNELSREADKAMSEYIANPTEENKQIAYAYDAFEKAYKKNNEKALDDENVKASWLTKSAAGYLPQFKDQILPEVIGYGVGALLGSAVGMPNVGAAVGSGIGTFSQSYGVLQGSIYRTLLAEGVDEEIAKSAAQDEALISSLIESGETAASVLLMGGTKAFSAIGGAAKASVAKGSTNAATKFVANLATKATANATNRAATKVAAEVARPLWSKGARLVGGIVANGLSEYGEEFSQGAVSRANQERALSGDIDGKGQLIKGASKVFADAVTGKDPKALADLHSQGMEGFKIGVMFGGTNATVNNIVSHYANAKTVKLQNEVADTILEDEESLNALIEEGKASGAGTVSEKIATEIETARENGKEVTREQVKQLIESNEVYIKAEEQTVDPLEQTAREVVEERNRTPIYERLEAQSRNNEPISVSDAKKVTGFGDNGAELVANLTNVEGATFYETTAEVKPSYIAGFNNPDMDIKKVAHTFTSQAQEDAYTAGQKDAIMQNSVAEAKAKKARVFGAESGVVINEHSAKRTPKQIKMSDTIGKDLGSQVSFEERLIANLKTRAEANAWHQDGEIKISNDSDNKFIEDIMEESLHRIGQIDTEVARVLRTATYEFVTERERSRGVEGIAFDEEKALYDNAGETIDTRGIIEEVSVGTLATELFRNEKEWLRWRAKLDTDSKLRQAWYKLMDVVSEIIWKIERLLAEKSFSKETREKVNKELAELKRLKGLYTDAYIATKDAVAEKTNNKSTETQTETRSEVTQSPVASENKVENKETPTKPKNKPQTKSKAVKVGETYTANRTGKTYTITDRGKTHTTYTVTDKNGKTTTRKTTNTAADINFNRKGDEGFALLGVISEKVKGVKAGDVFTATGTTYKIVSRDAQNTKVEISSKEGTQTMLISNEIADRNFTNMSAEGITKWIDEDEHIDNRYWDEVGDRKVKAFQFLFPEMKEYYTPLANELLGDLDNTIQGERMKIGSYEMGNEEWIGTERFTSEAIATIKDNNNATYDDIRNALNRLINDEGQENIALAKRIELVFDEMLTKGYNTFDGMHIPPNEEYITKKEALIGKEYKKYEPSEWDEDLPFFSLKVTDKKTLDFLENQEHITTYKAMQLIDGKLYPPMAAKTKGADGKYHLNNASELGVWQQAVEDPSNIKFDKNKNYGYYVLNKGDGSSVTAAYNPYEHSSNLVLNDQFEGAYKRDNIVTVECVIPKTEMTSGYKAQHAKDATGVLDWKSGVVAGKIKDNKRKVYLSRYLKPVRIMSDAETAKMYKEALGNSNVSVPFNVVTPSLLSELEKIGVSIDYEGSPMYKSNQERKKAKSVKRYSLKDSEGNTLTEAQAEFFKDSKVRDDNGNLLVMYHGTPNATFAVFRSGTYFTEHKWYADRYQSQGASSLSYKKTADNPDTYAVYLNIKKPFDTRNKTERDIFYNEYYRQYGTGTDLMQSGLPDWMDGDDLQEFLDEKGYDYDGLILDEGAVGGYGEEVVSRGLAYVAFSPEQVKNIDNLNPTSNPDIRFSLKKPVEETKNLIAVHNMQVSELERTLDLGGLPMPSIAVIKAQSGHSEYGDVSLVFSKETIDPKSNKDNKVYGGDAWTPTYPKIEYKPNAKIAKNISDKYYELSKTHGYEETKPLYNYVYDLEEQLNRNKGETGMLNELYDDTRLMQLYLLASGKDKVETINKETRTELSDEDVKFYEFFIKELGTDVVDAVMWNGNSTPMEHRKNYMSKYGDAIREAYKKLLSETYHFTEEQIQNTLDSTKTFDYLKFVRDAHNYRQNGRVIIKKEADYEATQNAIKKTVGEDYRKWVDSLFKGIEEKSGIRNNADYFTNSGNPRSWEALHWENNLENVVKVMKGNTDVGGGTFFSGHSIWGVAAKNYRSIEEIKADSDRLKQLPEEEYNQIKEGFGERLTEIAHSIMDKSERNPFIASDNAMECIVESVRNSKTKSGILSNLKQYQHLTVTETTVDDIVSLVSDIANMPTEYFEAKPKRAVTLNEIATAIIPDKTSESTKARLSDMGIKYLEYESGNEQARLEALNSLEDVKFSLKGGISPMELLDTIGNAQKGKKGATEKLAKYVDSGLIRTKTYDELIEKYGVIPSGERPHRDVQVPRKSGKKKNVSQTVRTILEAKATPDETVPTIEKMVEDGIFSYDVYTDKAAIEDGENYIKTHRWEQSLIDWFEAVNSGEVSKEITTTGWILYNHAANKGDTKTAIMILDAMVRCQRSAAQALQATRILKKLSPESQLYGVQQSVEAFQKELINKYGDKAPDLQINEELAEKFLTAETEEERLDAEIEIYKDIGRQMPSNWMDKWNAWRYVAMLTNPRTHIRNILGNAFFAPVVATKNLTATVIESMVAPVVRLSGREMIRGKAFVWSSKTDRALLKAAWNDYSNVADIVSNGGKYNDSAMGNKYIQEGRRIFKGILTPVEWVRRGNSKLLELEDMWFSQPHYAYALAQYCKANNITPEQIQRGKAIAPAREYAIREAQKATYKDTNAFSQMVSEVGRHGKRNWATNAKRTLAEGVLPFRKTPANILARGVEYSPIGFIKSLFYDLHLVKKGKMQATEAIDNISAGFTGSMLFALGAYLAAQGLIRGHGEEEKDEKEFKELMGHQDYSLELPNGQSVTLDWLAPESLPFFTGVSWWEIKTGDKKDLTLADLQTALNGISDPMLEMSFLQGLNDALASIGYAQSNEMKAVPTLISTIITSYLSQGIPTLFGQIERTGEEERMTTFTEKDGNLTKDTQYALGKASAKIPFWDYNQIPYIDAWGRREASGTALKRGLNNFLNPAYTSTIETSDMEEELLQLYELTGDGGVFPSRADKYFTVDGERKDLTAEEYVRYATLKGEKSYELVSDLVESRAYQKLSATEQVKAIKEAYDYANQKAKQTISNYKPETWVYKADEFGSNVGNYISFKTEVSGKKEANGGKISKQEVVDIVLNMAQNDSETWKMYLSMYDSSNDLYAYNEGVNGEDYMYFLESLAEVDTPTKSGKYGTYTQDEAKEAVKQLEGLSREEKAILWQSVNTSWKAKNNPWR